MATNNMSRTGGTMSKKTGKGAKAIDISIGATTDSLQKLNLGGSLPAPNDTKKGSNSKGKKPKKSSGVVPAAPAPQPKKPPTGPVLLGLPDTPISAGEDVDPYVTKIGGVPNWLDASMPAPSNFRIVRGMKLNPEYASKLEKKKKAAAPATPAANPFGAPAAVDLGNALFGGGPTAFSNPFAQPAALGSSPFGATPGFGSSSNGGSTSGSNPFGAPAPSANPFGAPSNSVGAFPIPSGGNLSFASAAAANLSTTNDESSEEEEDTIEEDDGSTEWPEKPSAFQPYYLYITEEVLNDSEADDELVAKYKHYIAMGEEQLQDEEEGEGGASWGGETYEKDNLPKGMDKAFQKFTERVQASGSADQCVRYEFPGTPLLFSYSDETAKLLLPLNATHHSKHTTPSAHRIAKCPACGGPRAFELQLMPNTLSMLKVSSREHLSEEELASLKTRKGAEQFNVGMEWGTILVYSCADDCFADKKKTKKKKKDQDADDDDNDNSNDDDKYQVRYYEEVALVQLEDY
ncbi:hypothetical protein BGW42_008663 [Actinomortierella wolfii]|nr:hypothetical protein BGW42_008663 [Actinomortierella wolfii]